MHPESREVLFCGRGRDEKKCFEFRTFVAVDKRIGLLNQGATNNIQSSRVIGTGTPIRIQPVVQQPSIARFLKQDDALMFNSEKTFYESILEEDDDALFRWYPMRILYGREQKAKSIAAELQNKGFDYYLHEQQVTSWYGREPSYNPSVYNIVFVHAMKIQLKLLKRFNSECSKMMFMTIPPRTQEHTTQIIWIPDRQMNDFLLSATCPDPYGQRIPLTYNDFIDKLARKVRILTGPFAGVEGEVKRINRHRIVVALLRDARVAIGITHVPPENLEFLD